jgi:predicted ATP-grasp superfamily ATP-dependent carboligase
MPQRHRQQVLLFEWLCGGGLLYDAVDPAQELDLIRQGRQMVSAVSQDFQVAGLHVCLPRDSRISTLPPPSRRETVVSVTSGPRLPQLLSQLAKAADWILVIAPETGGRLSRCLDWLRPFRDRMRLNPDPAFVALAADKNALQRLLGSRDVPVPAGGRVSDFRLRPAARKAAKMVLKPSDGCGGESLRLIDWPADSGLLKSGRYDDWRLEEFVPGVPASVSVLMGHGRERMLPPLRQVFEQRPVGRFANCVDDLADDVSARATSLARQAVAALPRTTGYFGIDMIIGDCDVVLEINPRITMSWCCLREVLPFNLAAGLLETVDRKTQEAE